MSKFALLKVWRVLAARVRARFQIQHAISESFSKPAPERGRQEVSAGDLPEAQKRKSSPKRADLDFAIWKGNQKQDQDKPLKYLV